MFFKLHSEGKIGFKKMSNADLGLGTSHQTHIGLYEDIFTFLHDREVEEEAYLIYNDNIDIVNCYFDRIEIPNGGGFRSPKIRKGSSISVTTIIRDKAKENPNYDWFLIWFGLENEQMVFYFFNNHSKDFDEVRNILDLSKNGRIDNNSVAFSPLLSYLENKINKSGSAIIEDLEIASQVGVSKKYRPFDLAKANEMFQTTGAKGEEIIANYLEYQKYKNQIFSYNWFNRSSESGLPYDFSIQKKDQQVIYIDVKSTGFIFERPMIFSNQEIEFINNSVNYHIYRVFGLSEEKPKLRICQNSKQLANTIFPHISTFNKSLLEANVLLRTAKLTVDPTNPLFCFDKEILLQY